jgi:hypothetical protein
VLPILTCQARQFGLQERRLSRYINYEFSGVPHIEIHYRAKMTTTAEQEVPIAVLLRRSKRQNDDQASPDFQSPHDPYGWMSRTDRAALRSVLLSTEQIEAIAKDTRLPGEIGCTYEISAAVVIGLQERARRRIRKRAKMAGSAEPRAQSESKAKSE